VHVVVGKAADSPAVLVAYTSMRAATAEHGTLGPQISSALMLATASAVGNDYVVAITSRLAAMMGWSDEQVAALRAGTTFGDNTIDTLTGLVREAAVNAGNVKDTTWTTAQDRGLERRTASRGVRLSRPDRLHRLLPQLRADRHRRMTAGDDE
jgi:hypothetical protein